MDRKDVAELHSIQHVSNLPSILARGLLSHNGAQAIDHVSVAMEEIQDIRRGVTVPGGLPLHDYVNLYFHARNPMMYRIRRKHANLCVLRIDPSVLDLPDVVVTDGNASSDYIRFGAAMNGLAFIDEGLTFARRWTDPDTFEYWRKKRARCAEVLIPNSMAPEHIVGAYVCTHGADALEEHAPGLSVIPDDDLFFC